MLGRRARPRYSNVFLCSAKISVSNNFCRHPPVVTGLDSVRCSLSSTPFCCLACRVTPLDERAQEFFLMSVCEFFRGACNRRKQHTVLGLYWAIAPVLTAVILHACTFESPCKYRVSISVNITAKHELPVEKSCAWSHVGGIGRGSDACRLYDGGIHSYTDLWSCIEEARCELTGDTRRRRKCRCTERRGNTSFSTPESSNW